MKKRFLSYGLLSAALLLAACGDTEETPEETGTEDAVEQPADEEGTTDEVVESTDAVIKVAYTAPHGDKAFASTFVVMNGDVVHDVIIDEFQFMEGDEWTGVPNADKTFGEKYAEESTLISKRENSEGYSARMTEVAESTVSYNDNMDAIQDFAIGKTVEEIEAAIADLGDLGDDGEIADVVSGATFVDTSGYLQSVVDTINDGMEFAGVTEADLTNTELSYSLQAPHGEQSFALVAVLHDGDNVLAAAMDELQFVDPADFDGVPNSDAGFGESFNEDVVLASKMFNDDAYSAMMTNIAEATLAYSESMLAITDHSAGSTTEEIESTVSDLENLEEDGAITDVVSGSTFVDTAGYLQAIVDTLK